MKDPNYMHFIWGMVAMVVAAAFINSTVECPSIEDYERAEEIAIIVDCQVHGYTVRNGQKFRCHFEAMGEE